MRTKLKPKDLVITVAGPHGSGRTTHAKRLAEAFHLKYVSTGTIFRERAKELGISLEEMTSMASKDDSFDRFLDERTKSESQRGGVVLDATLSGWMAEDPDLRICLKAPFEERVRRISKREGRNPDEVEKETKIREDIEHERFRRYYGINIDDLSIYDLVLNTSLFDEEESANILKNVVELYLGER